MHEERQRCNAQHPGALDEILCWQRSWALAQSLVWWVSSGFAVVSGAQLWSHTAVIALAAGAGGAAKGQVLYPANMTSCISAVNTDSLEKLLSAPLKQTHILRLCVSP